MGARLKSSCDGLTAHVRVASLLGAGCVVPVPPCLLAAADGAIRGMVGISRGWASSSIASMWDSVRAAAALTR